ncbi:MAG: lipoyl(octanoyl) transferase [Deltaproteobacteria bacterium]|nr:lipoyl(octanoyl) transferase [Deltaproteobacteria bacterium]
MEIIDLGLIGYAEARAVQLARLPQVAAGGEGAVYLLEHPPVITLGRHGGRENLLMDEARLRTMGIELVQAERGGNITCHFPGQLVAYPVLKIVSRRGGVAKFFFDLEEVVIQTLARFGLAGERVTGRPGVWIGPRKIASIGIGMRRWTSYHGLALNIGSDLSLFRLITPCGLTGVQPTSIHLELGSDTISMQEVKDVCADRFRALFENSALVAG